MEGLDGERYYDKVRERYATQTGDVTFIGPTDRVYTSTRRSRSSTRSWDDV